MQELLNRNRDVDQIIKRNIVSLRVSENLFDDLSDGDDELSQLAMELERSIKSNIPININERAFHYTTAIEYPFTHEPYLSTRFGNGTYPVWYGSINLETTIYETAFHMVRSESQIEGINEIIYRERAVYDVHCHALLVDLIGKEEKFPQLITNDYDFTQQIANRLHKEGHPGLVAPSARYKSGDNFVVFRKAMLSDSRLNCYLGYAYDPQTKSVRVEREPGVELMVVNFE